MIFATPELDEESLQVIAATDSLKNRLGSVLSQPPRWTGQLRRTLLAKAIQGSNTIEGYNVTVDDAIAAIEEEQPLESDADTWAEIMGYRQAMTYVIQLATEPALIVSADLIKSLHFMLLQHDLTKLPGRWRPGHIYVRREETGEVVYEGPDAGVVPELMAELVSSLNVTPNDDPTIVRAAMAHLNLVMIHPFKDGNGRMARCLQTLMLARGGHLHPAFVSIEEYLGRNTPAYYHVLAEVGAGAWHPERDAMPWIRFCLTAHFRQATTQINRLERIHRIWDALEVEIKQRKLDERMLLALADAALGFKVRNATYRKLAGVSDAVAGNDLRALTNAGLLEPKGEKRGRYYVASPSILDIRKASETKGKSVPDPFRPAVKPPDKPTH